MTSVHKDAGTHAIRGGRMGELRGSNFKAARSQLLHQSRESMSHSLWYVPVVAGTVEAGEVDPKDTWVDSRGAVVRVGTFALCSQNQIVSHACVVGDRWFNDRELYY